MLADGGRAFEFRGAVGNGLRFEVKIMWGRLRRQRYFGLTGAAENVEPSGRREMDDVGMCAGLTRELVDKSDGFIFRRGRTRGEVALVGRAIARQRGLGLLDRAGQLGMNDEWRPGPAQRQHRLLQTVRDEMTELRHAGLDEEALEADRARVEHPPEPRR